jgi:hypothetical protein
MTGTTRRRGRRLRGPEALQLAIRLVSTSSTSTSGASQHGSSSRRESNERDEADHDVRRAEWGGQRVLPAFLTTGSVGSRRLCPSDLPAEPVPGASFTISLRSNGPSGGRHGDEQGSSSQRGTLEAPCICRGEILADPPIVVSAFLPQDCFRLALVTPRAARCSRLELHSCRKDREEASTSTVGGVSSVLLIAVAASGCQSFDQGRRPFSRPDLLTVKAEPRASSRSDRLRSALAQASPPLQAPDRSGPTADMPARAPEPAPPQDWAQPQQPARPSIGPLPQGRDEPDPRAVIDWLLKERR